MKKNIRKLPICGFTLVEVLLAAAILASAISAILATYYSCFILIGTSKNINIATNAAMGLMEEIRSSPFNKIAENATDGGYNGLNFIVNNIPQSRGVVYVDSDNPELLQVTISVCWRQGNRIMGEDTNLNGQLDAGEVDNGNNIIDSPVQLVTIIANR
jgi:prepilin-type N-terminal cleavage/methylation domain-containing protein